MLSSETLGQIRTSAFALSGAACALYALTTVLLPHSELMPKWVPIIAAVGLATVFFLATWLAGTRSADAALDESYKADNLRAAAWGFWSALCIGTLLWLTGAGGTMQLAVTLTGSSSVYMLAHVVLDLRGRAWA